MSRDIRTFLFLLLALGVVLASPSAGTGQILASEPASVSQTLDGTTLKIDYYRPVARGRELFGGVVPWNVVWTPGANWATTLEVSRPVRLNGVAVPAGKYSVWAIPRPDRFTLTLNSAVEIFHFHKPDSTDAQIHISVVPVEAEHQELLTWSFPNVRGDAAVMQFQWGTTALPVQVIAEPSERVALSAEERGLYTGSYHLEMTPGLGWPDSGTFEVVEVEGRLRARMPFGIHPEDDPWFDLVPAGEGRFNPGLYRDGALFGVEMGVNIEFSLGTDVARAVRWYGPMGTPFAAGERVEGAGTP